MGQNHFSFLITDHRRVAEYAEQMIFFLSAEGAERKKR